MINKSQEQLADKLAELLAGSSLDERFVELILERIDKLPESTIQRLADSLENEKEEFERLSFELDLFLRKQSESWTRMSEQQKDAARVLADKWILKLS